MFVAQTARRSSPCSIRLRYCDKTGTYWNHHSGVYRGMYAYLCRVGSISWLVVQFRSQNHALRRSEVAAQMLVNCSEVVKSLPIDQVTEELIEKNTRSLLDELSWKDAKLKAVVTSIEQPIPCKRVHLNIFWRAPSGIEQSLRGLTFWSFASDTSGSQQP